MDNIGDYLYIIILLVFIVGNAIMAGLKKKEKQNRTGPPPESTGRPVSDQFDDVFGELFGREEKEEIPQPKPVKKRKPQPESAEPASDYLKRMTERAERAKAEASKPITISPALQIEELGDQRRMPFHINMKQAIVHQAVLEPRFQYPYEQ